MSTLNKQLHDAIFAEFGEKVANAMTTLLSRTDLTRHNSPITKTYQSDQHGEEADMWLPKLANLFVAPMVKDKETFWCKCDNSRGHWSHKKPPMVRLCLNEHCGEQPHPRGQSRAHCQQCQDFLPSGHVQCAECGVKSHKMCFMVTNRKDKKQLISPYLYNHRNPDKDWFCSHGCFNKSKEKEEADIKDLEKELYNLHEEASEKKTDENDLIIMADSSEEEEEEDLGETRRFTIRSDQLSVDRIMNKQVSGEVEFTFSYEGEHNFIWLNKENNALFNDCMKAIKAMYSRKTGYSEDYKQRRRVAWDKFKEEIIKLCADQVTEKEQEEEKPQPMEEEEEEEDESSEEEKQQASQERQKRQRPTAGKGPMPQHKIQALKKPKLAISIKTPTAPRLTFAVEGDDDQLPLRFNGETVLPSATPESVSCHCDRKWLKTGSMVPCGRCKGAKWMHRACYNDNEHHLCLDCYKAIKKN